MPIIYGTDPETGEETRSTVLLDYQYDYVLADDPWLLGDGGRGSGKSYGLCNKLADRAGVPGAREGLFRQKLTDLKSTTLVTLLEGDGNNPPVLMPGGYHHNQGKKTIDIRGGGQIIYNGMDQGDASREAGSTGKGSSLNLTGAAFDEWVEIPENVMLQVTMGVRVQIPGLPLQRYGVCNPSTPMHHLARRFGITDETTRHPKARRIVMPSKDNIYNPPEFLEELASLTGVARMRYWDGLWVGADGLVYDRFLRSDHIRDWERPERFEKGQIMGVDEGYAHPFAVVDIGIDPDGKMWVRNEVHRSKMTQAEKIDAVKSLWRGDCPVVVDSAAPDLIESLIRAGVRAVPADKGPGSVNYGIGVVQGLLAKRDESGEPWLSYSSNCTNTIREKESYEWLPGVSGIKDQPRKINDDAMDAERYALRYITEERGGRVLSSDIDADGIDNDGSLTPEEARQADDDWGWD